MLHLLILKATYTNQSMAQRSETSLYGASMAERTISMRTKAADGTDADAMEAAVEVKTTVASFHRSEMSLPTRFYLKY